MKFKSLLALLIATFILAGFASNAWPLLKKLESMNEILGLTVKDDEPSTAIEMNADVRNKIDGALVKLHPAERSVTISLPGCYIDPPKKYFNKLASDVVKRATIFQLNPKTAMLNVWLKPGYELVEDRVRVEQKDDKIVIRFWKAQPPPAVLDLGKTQPPPPEEKTEEQAKTEPAPVLNDPIDLSKLFAESDRKEEAKITPETAEPPRAQENGGIGSKVPSIGESAVKMAGALFLCLGLIALGFAIYKRFMKGSPVFGAALKRPLRIVSSIAIGPKKQITVLDVGGELFLVGASENQIGLLAKIENPQTIERLRNGKADAAAVASGTEKAGAPKEPSLTHVAGAENPFISELAREMNKYKEAADGANGSNGSNERTFDAGAVALKAVRERLANMKRL